ncbi:MAG: N-formylglutamate deformylase [Woeseiaceae bacterium]|nr:N-formylglutamate deformylase [Woeseiaceae bacterium]NIP21843.1 N-formylglutamate deformylase [Woeseiaceae bacterium]NIS90928.1 N-formylglutamate deformylase [Woeseiaceae bacterium]
MSVVFDFHEGNTALLISIPHDGRDLPSNIAAAMSEAGRALPDTDWHVARLYRFASETGASIISARYSRYVVDLNRPTDDAALYQGREGTSVCPRLTFDGRDIYSDSIDIDVAERLARYWHPYHQKIEMTLTALRDRHGVALLWDAHSIASRVPLLFDGELPVLNIGSFDGRSCSEQRERAVMNTALASPYDTVLNGRFKGGFITRHYGDPGNDIHAIQLELAQRAYMDEASGRYDEEKASQLGDTLRAMLAAFTMAA